ncbi:MAG: sialate O-acetylesterase [Planctomycetaceae bacterium]|nr:sialate O-acetylesterase [Planctomycetaceae bacterium]
MRSIRWRSFVLTSACCLLLTSVSAADLRLPSIFGDKMVLQRDMPVPVWGWANPGEKVTVTFRDQTQTVTADGDGKWSARLQPLAVGDAATLQVAAGQDKVELSDVLVGEVWVCSGPSNMQWSVQLGLDPDLEAAAALHPDIRLFQVPMVTATEPQEDVEAKWTNCTPETIPTFSAVAYYFGRNLHDVLQVPVGIVQTAWGGTRAEAWTSPEMMASVTAFQPILDSWEKSAAAYNPDTARKDYEQALAKWEEESAKAKADGKPAPRKPQMQEDPRRSPHHHSTLFNAMIAPLSPFAIRGAIWYQGESNANRAYQYRTLMPSMIQSWRDDWQQGDFPFYMVQLANFREIGAEPGDSDWAELREAQMMTIDALPNVGVACITDLGAAKDIHPKNKQDVGKRLARLALADVYGLASSIIRSGPVYDSVEFADGKATVKFKTGGSRVASWYGEPLKGFAVAGEDKKWVWANAKATGEDTIEVWSASVPEPVAVRYNWSDNPQGNLLNAHMLPAYPFRTDDWTGVTVNNVNP